jgi:hypothetical protein
MMKKFSVLVMFLLIVSTLTTAYARPLCSQREFVTISDKGNYFEVNIDVKRSKSHWKMGQDYANRILQAVPDYEILVDSYLEECSGTDEKYMLFIKRIGDIKPQIDKDYRDEMEGMASVFSGKSEDARGDGKISLQEIYMLNLFPDIARATQCSALAVYAERSATKKTMAKRILDWYQGSQNQLAKIQSVTTYKNGKKSICSIGYLGFIGIISGFNNDRVFAAILDSKTGAPFESESKRSYPLDLRSALENCKNLYGVGEYLKFSERKYTYGHLIFLCDPNTATVLENNMSEGAGNFRRIRTERSDLNDGIEWGIDNSLGTVNSFMLKGNFNNYDSQSFNVLRWENMKAQLSSKGDRVTLDELKQIASYYPGSTVGKQEEGALYNVRTQQIIIYEPCRNNLEVFFRPKDGVLPLVPNFEKVKVKF